MQQLESSKLFSASLACQNYVFRSEIRKEKDRVWEQLPVKSLLGNVERQQLPP